ncbi:MAG TPA: hypothetical protein DCQ31_16610 [Bacteroidales bacterium]|nr:hypothetical protein [Bacteroidales bacterium]
MFSFFKKKKPSFINTIYMTDAAKLNALFQLVKNAANTEAVLVFSSFEESLFELKRNAELQGITCHEMTSVADFNQGKVLNLLASVRLLEPSFSKPNAMAAVKVLGLEHYPILKTNELLFDACIKNYAKAVPVIYLSFDSPVMTIFGSDRIKEILGRLGMDPNESIEHSMINDSIKNALEKVNGAVTFEKKTTSESEWYKMNYKSK